MSPFDLPFPFLFTHSFTEQSHSVSQRYSKSESSERAVSRFSPTGIPGYTQPTRLANFFRVCAIFIAGGVFIVSGEASWDMGAPWFHSIASHLKMSYLLLHYSSIHGCKVFLAFPTFFALRRINAIIRIAMAPRPHSYLHCPLANPRWALGGCKGPHFIPILPSTPFFLRFLFTLIFGCAWFFFV